MHAPTEPRWRSRALLFRALCALGALASAASTGHAGELRLATFEVDATPPLGSPIAYTPADRVDDPLSARGVVLLPEGAAPIVLCAVDWIGIANEGLDAWRSALAEAAGTTAARVAVHTLHQHDAPRCDFAAEAMLAERGLGGRLFDAEFARRTIASAAAAIRESVEHESHRVTHVGAGGARVEKVASTRRLLGEDGTVEHVRFSSCADPEVRALPEGRVDPWLRLVAFFDGERPLASLTYYACHPQSYYREGGVSADFVGLARAAREADLPDLLHVHFNGAGGDVAAGKYNDGSHPMRAVLTERLAAGMRAAWEAVEKEAVTSDDVDWRVERVELPLRDGYDAAALLATLDDASADAGARVRAATDLSYVRRVESGHRFDIACLEIGDVLIVHTPGELFVEYQLAAQGMRPDAFVAFAAYGDYGPGYIGTEASYEEGGYEVRPTSSRTAPAVERVLLPAIRAVLEASAVGSAESAESAEDEATPPGEAEGDAESSARSPR